MGREVRMVPGDWQHPKDDRGHYTPLLKGPYSQRVAEWDEGKAKWDQGLRLHFGTNEWVPIDSDMSSETFEEWDGDRPTPDNYMPEFPKGSATHLMMYEDTTEGTPISPAFATPEGLAQWLADNGASAFGRETASYDQWLAMAKSGWAPSAVMTGGTLKSGVADCGDNA